MPDTTMKRPIPFENEPYITSAEDYGDSIYMQAVVFAQKGESIIEGLRTIFNGIPMEARPNFRRGCLLAIEEFTARDQSIINALEKFADGIEAVKNPGKVSPVIRIARGLHNV